MRKFRFFLDFEKEERWLNQMAAEGFELVGKSVAYRFRPSKPENAIIKIDYRIFKNEAHFQDYCALFEDSGWKHIAGTRKSGTQYFKKVDRGASEDIFSDVDSKAGRYKRMSQMYIALSLMYLPIFIALVTFGPIELNALLHPKSLYYTPGLWEKTGDDFWWAFLFETPFALFRGISLLFFPLTLVLYLIFGFKAEWAYRKTKKTKNG